MNANPAFHPHTLDGNPDAACAPENRTAGAMGAGRVKPLPIVPCSPEFDRDEPREYGGVEAGFLAWAAPELLRRKWDIGIGAIHHALWKFSTKVQNALFTYSRVKRAMRWLHEPQEVSLYIDDMPRRKSQRAEPIKPAHRPIFKWAVTPKDVYQWEACKTRYGFDVRGTSLAWIERGVRDARAKARRKAMREFRERQSVMWSVTKDSAPQDTPETSEIIIRTFEPAPAQFGEIWPPVPIPEIADAPVTVTPDYASERKAKMKADPDEAVIGVIYIINESNRREFRNDQTWWLLTGQYDMTVDGLVYADQTQQVANDTVFKPP